MNLIVPAELCEPPSEGLMFRHLLMVSKLDLLYSNLVFCQEDMVDLYYHYMKERFIFDFVDDIVTQQEDGGTLNRYSAASACSIFRATKADSASSTHPPTVW